MNMTWTVFSSAANPVRRNGGIQRYLQRGAISESIIATSEKCCLRMEVPVCVLINGRMTGEQWKKGVPG